MEYLAFTDESYISNSRYRSLCSFSFKKDHLKLVNDSLRQLLTDSDVQEFKWEKLKNAKYKFCAEKITSFILDELHRFEIRIDVLIWDTYDSRHAIPNRDDEANYERLFFHLLKDSMKRRPIGSRWEIYPDEKMGIDWPTIHDCLNAMGKKDASKDTYIHKSFFIDSHYTIDKFQEIESHLEPCCQVSDLFAGLSVFSRQCYPQYSEWKRRESSQQTLDLFGVEPMNLSNSEERRSVVLHGFNNRCKKLKLGVSLDSEKCLKTFDPQRPINFWTYVPQSFMDKAPTNKESQ